MHERELSESIKLYLDDNPTPFKVAPAPLTFQLDTIALPDGPHKLRIEASNGLAPPTLKDIPFVVRNGVAVTATGLDEGQEIAGQVQMVINAYAGSTEVDFEPRRAETPQPVPTWAWVVLLAVLAWTMYYVITPQVHSSAAHEPARHPTPLMGRRIFADTCARCHGEQGEGRLPTVPPLRDAEVALLDSPAELLMQITATQPTSTPNQMMPEWGTRLTNAELVAVVNHVRRSWGHDSSLIRLEHRRPPEGIEELHKRFDAAILRQQLELVLDCCGTKTHIEPRIFRTDGVDQRGLPGVRMAWKNYFDALTAANARVTQILLADVRYDFDPDTVEQPHSIVIAAGRIFFETRNDAGQSSTAKGRFLRIYEGHGGSVPRWSMVFDFADIPMAIGCVPGTVICRPGEEPADAPAATPVAPGPSPASAVGFDDVQTVLLEVARGGRSAPHGQFWKLPYDDFVGFAFEEEIGEAGRIRLLVPWHSRHSNLIRALEDGKGIVVDYPDGTTRVRDDIPRMPQGGKYLAPEQVAIVAAWIDAGCPRFAGGPPLTPRTPAPEAADGAPRIPAPPAESGAPGGFPAPTPVPAAPGGFPAPAPVPAAPGGFPAPAPAPGGFPAPAPPPGDAKESEDLSAGVISYADVQALLRGLKKKAPTAPHETFWDLSYAEFVKSSFPSDIGEDDRIRVLVPGNAGASNLIRALRDGKGIVVTLPDGKRKTIDVGPMPKGGRRLQESDIRKIEKWIDAGCPEFGREK